MSFQKSWTTSKLSSNTSLEVASENTNTQSCCAYGIFLQQFKALAAFSHPYFWSFHLFFQGISLPDPSSHPFICAYGVFLRRFRPLVWLSRSFKPAPSAEQASTSENDDKFSLRILTPFSSSCYSCSKRQRVTDTVCIAVMLFDAPVTLFCWEFIKLWLLGL